MKTEIISELRKADGYLSGQELCNRLHVSRTAVWKVIGQLREEGYEIEAVKNRGYRLTKVPDLVTADMISSCLHTKWAGIPAVFSYDMVGSTNDKAKELAQQEQHGTIVIADRQEAGKGRRGRTWVSPPGCSIFLSLLIKPDLHPSKASMLTLVMALSAAEAIEQQTGLSVQIKWPNDLVINGRKVCGILTEMSADMDGIHYVVIGIGINVNNTEFPDEVKEMASSLFLLSGRKYSRAQFIAELLFILEEEYGKFCDTGDLSLLQEEYNNRLVNCNREIRVLEPGQEYKATARGINRTGELVVDKPSGETVCVFAGEVSVRGLYGYV